MTDDELDALLRAIPDDEPTAEPIDDGKLLALDEATEAMLARNREARDLLAELRRPVSEATLAQGEAAFRGSRRRRQLARVTMGAGSLAAAALLAVMVWPAGGAPALDGHYTLEGPTGGVATERGEGPASEVFVPDSRLRLVARPDGPAAPSTIRVFAARGGRLVEATSPEIVSGPRGGARVEIRAGALFDEPGDWTLHVLVTPPGERSAVGSIDELEGVEALARFERRVRFQNPDDN